MATLTIGPPRLVKPDAGSREVLDNSYRIANGQSWSAGDFLYIDTSGLLNVCADDATVIKFFALEDVSDPGNNTTFASVIRITSDMEFEGHVWHATPASAVTATSQVGQYYGLDHANAAGTDTATGFPVVSIDDTSNDAFEVTALASDYDPSGRNVVGDQYGLVRFKVLPDVLDGDPA